MPPQAQCGLGVWHVTTAELGDVSGPQQQDRSRADAGPWVCTGGCCGPLHSFSTVPAGKHGADQERCVSLAMADWHFPLEEEDRVLPAATGPACDA